MSDALEICEHWTGPIYLRLKADGNVMDLSGMTVELLLRDKSNFRISTTSSGEFGIFTSSSFTWPGGTGPVVITATDGYVQYVPTTHDLSSRRSPYRARVKVTDGASRASYFPSAATSVWTIYEE